MGTGHRNNQLALGDANHNLLHKIMGKTITCGKLRFGVIMLLAAFLLWLSPAYGSGTITEDFTNNHYNTNLWSLWDTGQGVSAQVISNRLEGTVSGIGYGGLSGWGFTLIGDFEVRVDFTLINWPENNRTQLTLGTYNLSPDELFHVGRGGDYNPKEVYFTYIMNNYHNTAVTGPTSNGTLRMVRTGNKMEGFYWNGTGWQSIGSVTDASLGTRVAVFLGFGPLGNDYSGISAKSAFSNIQIDYTTLGPSFEQHNPGPGIMMLLFD